MSELNEAELRQLCAGRVYIAGHSGMVGTAIVRRLEECGCRNLLVQSRDDLDLRDRQQVRRFLKQARPDFVFLAAATVGGIAANDSLPATFLYDNLMIGTNVIYAAHEIGVRRLLFLGSSCVYPRLAPQPMSEDCLLTGPLEPTNEPYAIAKIAGIKICESLNRQYGTDYRSIMPTNLYGPHDNFDLQTSHVLPALIRKFHEAKDLGAGSVEIWGTGNVRREFLHVDDLAEACLFVMCLPKSRYDEATKPMQSHLNAGTGTDLSIRELAELVRAVIGFEGALAFNTDRPDGMPRKLLNVSRLNRLGWRARISLHDGIEQTYHWYRDQIEGSH